MADAMEPVCLNTTACDVRGMTPRMPFDMPLSRQTWIDALVTQETATPKVPVHRTLDSKLLTRLVQVKNGVKIGEGDGTVPSISLGAMCVEGWKRKRWNPAGIKIVTYEVASSICRMLKK